MINGFISQMSTISSIVTILIQLLFLLTLASSGAQQNETAISSPEQSVTIHGMANEWHTILHTRNDQPAKVNPISVYLGYRLALAMVRRFDEFPCGAYR